MHLDWERNTTAQKYFHTSVGEKEFFKGSAPNENDVQPVALHNTMPDFDALFLNSTATVLGQSSFNLVIKISFFFAIGS